MVVLFAQVRVVVSAGSPDPVGEDVACLDHVVFAGVAVMYVNLNVCVKNIWVPGTVVEVGNAVLQLLFDRIPEIVIPVGRRELLIDKNSNFYIFIS